MPGTDFQDTHDRHWGDAEFLFDDDRLPNADQLYGLSAECGLKAVMHGGGALPMKEDMPAHRDHKVHIDRFWDTYLTHASGRAAPRLADENLFTDGSMSQRYMHGDLVDLRDVREHAWSTFLTTMYDEAPPPDEEVAEVEAHDAFSFDVSDDSAPHAPWPVRWSPSFASLATLHGRLVRTDAPQVDAAFGRLISGVATFTGRRDTIDS